MYSVSKMSFTQEELQIFQMRGINNYDNDKISSITGKNIHEVKSLITTLIHKMEKKMMPICLIAQNLNMNVEELDLYKENHREHNTSHPELYKRICELELNAVCNKHTEEQLRIRVAQLEEQLHYRLTCMEERIKLYCSHNTYTTNNRILHCHQDNEDAINYHDTNN